MNGVLSEIGQGFANAFLMAWEVWWALVLGFALSAIVQAWVPRERVERALGGSRARPVALATGLGAASSSCSYAAIAIAKSLFAKGASAASALAFQFASTNLVVELGIVLWVLIGWQFTLAELVGGLLMIVIMTALLRLFVTKRLERQARAHAEQVEASHQHRPASGRLTLRERLTSPAAWSDVAHNFRNDWAMFWKEITLGFLLAGFIGLLGNDFFNGLFIRHANPVLRGLENVVLGPIVAVLSFVCSVGNVPLAAVLWSGGISFGGVVAFLFADLIVVPIVLAYRKYYGTRLRAADHRADVRHDRDRGPDRRRAVRGTRADPACASDALRDLRRRQRQLQARAQRPGARRLCGPDWAYGPAWCARPRMRDEGRPPEGDPQNRRREDAILLLRALRRGIRPR